MIHVNWVKNPQTGQFHFGRITSGNSTHTELTRKHISPNTCLDSVPRGWFEIKPRNIDVFEYDYVQYRAGFDAITEYQKRNPRCRGRPFSGHLIGSTSSGTGARGECIVHSGEVQA